MMRMGGEARGTPPKFCQALGTKINAACACRSTSKDVREMWTSSGCVQRGKKPPLSLRRRSFLHFNRSVSVRARALLVLVYQLSSEYCCTSLPPPQARSYCTSFVE